MFALTIIAVTTAEHPDHELIGESYVACWIDRDSEADAIAAASDLIVEDGWEVIRVEQITKVTAADYDAIHLLNERRCNTPQELSIDDFHSLQCNPYVLRHPWQSEKVSREKIRYRRKSFFLETETNRYCIHH